MDNVRQSQLSFIPENFFEELRNKRVAVVGCGGIGSPLAVLLVRGGFENIKLIDFDVVDTTNLPRQVFFEYDLGLEKAIALGEHLRKINSNIEIDIFDGKLTKDNIDYICCDANLIVDATDDFKTRRIINEYCEETGKDWLYNGAIRTEFATCLFKGKDKLFNKVFPNKIIEERASEVGILSSTSYACASFAYNQILKYFLGVEEQRLVKINLWTNRIFDVKINPDSRIAADKVMRREEV
jgi:molybdopterin-synthase adenylyltransferase